MLDTVLGRYSAVQCKQTENKPGEREGVCVCVCEGQIDREGKTDITHVSIYLLYMYIDADVQILSTIRSVVIFVITVPIVSFTLPYPAIPDRTVTLPIPILSGVVSRCLPT